MRCLSRSSVAALAALVGLVSRERLAQAQVSVCAAGSTLEGVDVSVYDGTVDWGELKTSGRVFGVAKATEGSTFKDTQFPTNWTAMKSAGIVRSAYHFFHCDTDAATQATFFLGVMGTLEPGDLPPSLDFEDTTTCTPSTGVAMAITWLDAVASATGTLPTIYTSVRVLSSFDDTASLAGHARLWVASRGVTCPQLPAPFTGWSFWQYSLTGTAPGLPNSNGMADLDEFNGDMTALLALTKGGTSSAGSSSASSSGPPACSVDGVEGSCIDTSACASMRGHVSTPGLCPGPASEECCTPPPGASSSGSSGSSVATAGASSSGGVVATGSGRGDGGARESSGGAGAPDGGASRGGSRGRGSTASSAGGEASAGSAGSSGGCGVAAAGLEGSGAVVPAGLAGLGLVALSRRRRSPRA